MVVEITNTTAADVLEFFDHPLPLRIRAKTVRIDGEIKGIGGLAFLRDGTRVAFLEAAEDDCRKYRVTLHRIARVFMTEARAAGIKRMVASFDGKREASKRWLARLGFEPVQMCDGEVFYLWQH